MNRLKLRDNIVMNFRLIYSSEMLVNQSQVVNLNFTDLHIIRNYEMLVKRSLTFWVVEAVLDEHTTHAEMQLTKYLNIKD